MFFFVTIVVMSFWLSRLTAPCAVIWTNHFTDLHCMAKAISGVLLFLKNWVVFIPVVSLNLVIPGFIFVILVLVARSFFVVLGVGKVVVPGIPPLLLSDVRQLPVSLFPASFPCPPCLDVFPSHILI